MINRLSRRVKNLDLMTAGPTPPNPSELIGSGAFENILRDLNEIYDFILIDTANHFSYRCTGILKIRT